MKSNSVSVNSLNKTLSQKSLSPKAESRITLSESVYLLFFCVMLFAKAIGLYDGQPLYNIILVISAILFAAKLILTDYTWLELLTVCALLLCSIITYLLSGERGILMFVAVITGIKGCSVRRLFKWSAALLGICFVVMAALTQSGLVNDYFLVHNKGSLGYIVRWSFGYTHPNVMHITFIIIIAFILYSLKLNLKRLRIASMILMFANIYVFIYSVSYTGFILATLYLVLNYLLEYRKSRLIMTAPYSNSEKDLQNSIIPVNESHEILWKVFDFLLQLVFPFCVFFSVAGPVLFKGKLFDLCDKLVHHRFVLSNYFLTNEKLSVLGHVLKTTPDANRSLDCSYVYLLVHCGVLPFLLICVAYIMLIRHCIVKRKYGELSIIITLVIAGVTEPFMFNASFKNISALFIGEYLFELTEKAVEKSSIPIFLKKNFSLCKAGQHTLFFEKSAVLYRRITGNINSAVRTFSYNNVRILIYSAVAAVAITIIFGLITVRPVSVLIPTADCPDGYESTPAYYTEDEINSADMNDVRILSYSPDKEMVTFDGNTADIEYIRSLISCAVWSFAVSFIIIIFVVRISERKRLHP